MGFMKTSYYHGSKGLPDSFLIRVRVDKLFWFLGLAGSIGFRFHRVQASYCFE